MTIPFDEVQFPVVVALNARRTLRWNTNVAVISTGAEQRNQLWVNALHAFNVAAGIRSQSDYDLVQAFFHARRGRLRAFRMKDFADFKSCAADAVVSSVDQVVGTGPGPHQLIKSYADGANPWVRRIVKPVAGSVRVSVDGVEQASPGWSYPWAIATATGILTFTGSGPTLPAGGATIRAGFEFDVPARFNMDELESTLIEPGISVASSIDVIEIRI